MNSFPLGDQKNSGMEDICSKRKHCYGVTLFSWSGAILFVHKYTAGSTSSGDKANKLHDKTTVSE